GNAAGGNAAGGNAAGGNAAGGNAAGGNAAAGNAAGGNAAAGNAAAGNTAASNGAAGAKRATEQAPGLRGVSAQATHWITEHRSRLVVAVEERRQRSAVVDALFQIHDLDTNVGGGILAGALAYRMFLFMVPFVYVTFTVLGAASSAASTDPAQLAKSVGISGVLAHAVVNTHKLSTGTQILLMIGAVWALLTTSRSVTKALYAVHSLVWRVPRVKPKNNAAFAFIAIVLLMSFLVLGLNRLRGAAWGIGSVLTVVIVTALAFGLWWWVTTLLPHAGVPSWALIPGALLMAVGVELLHALTVYWIAHQVAKKSETYGAIGVALTVMLWTYLLGRIVVASAGMNATLWRRYEERSARLHRAPGGPSLPR
ncbi:MAG TPA: YhjD/YihY/BrkB family envelope integrity protein, partial [Acidimicrobiales bacterium]|nr:YhjD/YihY/BrkB family envelope integrity protein [Acidimicrobiales bacterium]